jgi:hypothetical protein
MIVFEAVLVVVECGEEDEGGLCARSKQACVKEEVSSSVESNKAKRAWKSSGLRKESEK